MTDACPNFGLFVVEVLSLDMGEFYLVEDTIWGLEGPVVIDEGISASSTLIWTFLRLLLPQRLSMVTDDQ